MINMRRYFQRSLLIGLISLVELTAELTVGSNESHADVFSEVVKSGTTDPAKIQAIKNSTVDPVLLEKARATSAQLKKDEEERNRKNAGKAETEEDEDDTPKSAPKTSGATSGTQPSTPKKSTSSKVKPSDPDADSGTSPATNSKVDAGDFPETLDFPGSEEDQPKPKTK